MALAIGLAGPARAFDDDYHEKINGTTLHFRVRGADRSHPYLLLLHGGPGFSAYMFYSWGPSLEKAVNVIYLDQRGSGGSERVKVANPFAPNPEEIKDYTIANLLKDIEGVREFLKVERWYVLGHSWGGMLGLEYVTAYPDRVLGYIHMDGLTSVPKMQEEILNSAQARFEADAKSGTAAEKSQAEAQLQTIRTLRSLAPDNPQRLFGLFGLAMGPAQLYFTQDQPTAFATFTQKIAEAAKTYNAPPASFAPANEPMVALMINDRFLTRDDLPLLAKVTTPTLIINGLQDGVITPKMAREAHAGIKGSKLLLLDDCGHFPFAEQPAKTTEAILAFVAKPQTR
jgi:proline iminopeptidase